jgi:hypothetical protein
VHDWTAIVRSHLGALDVAPDERELVVNELAAHLEDVYVLQVSKGLPETKAFSVALGEVSNWKKLSRKIKEAKRKEEFMNDRTRQLWLPGLVCFATAMISLMAIQFTGVKPYPLQIGFLTLPMFYLPWLVCLPIFGGLAAYLSRKAGARRSVIFLVTLFPSLMFLLSILFWVVPVTLFKANDPANAYIRAHFSAGTVFGILLLLSIPAVPLLLGALPFLRDAESSAHGKGALA